MLRLISNLFVPLKAHKQQEQQNKCLHILQIKVLLIHPSRQKKKTPFFCISPRSSTYRETSADKIHVYPSLHTIIATKNKWSRGKHLNLISHFLAAKESFLLFHLPG